MTAKIGYMIYGIETQEQRDALRQADYWTGMARWHHLYPTVPLDSIHIIVECLNTITHSNIDRYAECENQLKSLPTSRLTYKGSISTTPVRIKSNAQEVCKRN